MRVLYRILFPVCLVAGIGACSSSETLKGPMASFSNSANSSSAAFDKLIAIDIEAQQESAFSDALRAGTKLAVTGQCEAIDDVSAEAAKVPNWPSWREIAASLPKFTACTVVIADSPNASEGTEPAEVSNWKTALASKAASVDAVTTSLQAADRGTCSLPEIAPDFTIGGEEPAVSENATAAASPLILNVSPTRDGIGESQLRETQQATEATQGLVRGTAEYAKALAGAAEAEDIDKLVMQQKSVANTFAGAVTLLGGAFGGPAGAVAGPIARAFAGLAIRLDELRRKAERFNELEVVVTEMDPCFPRLEMVLGATTTILQARALDSQKRVLDARVSSYNRLRDNPAVRRQLFSDVLEARNTIHSIARLNIASTIDGIDDAHHKLAEGFKVNDFAAAIQALAELAKEVNALEQAVAKLQTP